MSRQSKRDSNIELLRMLAAFAVVILHFNNPLYVNGLNLSTGIDHDLLVLLECISIPTVDVFVMISGYFGVKKQSINISKLISLEIKVIVIFAVSYLVQSVLDAQFNLKQLAFSAIPNNYYITLYIVVILLSPYVNRLLLSLNEKTLNKFVCTIVLLFSLYTTLLDCIEHITNMEASGLNVVGMYGSGRGYTVVNFIMCYIIGAWLRLYKDLKLIPTRFILLIWFGAQFFLLVWYNFQPEVSLAYYNIFVLISAAALLLIFSRIKMHNIIINRLSTASLTCFLINIPVLTRTVKPDVFRGGHVMAVVAAECIGIYLLAWLFDRIYGPIDTRINKWLYQLIDGYREKDEVR